MITIFNSRQSGYTGENADLTRVVAELFVDSKSELSGLTEINGKILHQGSVALIITESKIAVFGSDGNWYIDGEVIS